MADGKKSGWAMYTVHSTQCTVHSAVLRSVMMQNPRRAWTNVFRHTVVS